MRISIDQLYSIFLQYPKVCTDTRNILQDSIFFALKGANFNGNEFAQKAIELGAKYVVIDEEAYQLNENYLLVDDVLLCMQELAKHHRLQLNIPVLGITGSNGKTTSKELINAALSKKYKTLATKGNLNNHIGVPLTLLSITNDIEFAIIEMGANHQEEIAFLSNIACPDFALVSNVGKAHLDGMGGFEGVKKTKKELYDYVKENNGLIFINSEDDNLLEMSNGIEKRIAYGNAAGSIISGSVESSNPLLSIKFNITGNLNSYIVKTHLVGDYNLSNVLAAICIANYFEVPTQKIIEGLENYIPENNRSQEIIKGSNKIIMDAYNANPSSMLAAITNFSKLSDPNKLLILGDMFELGKESNDEHQKIIEAIFELNFREVVFVGNDFFNNKKYDYIYFQTTENAAAWLNENPFLNYRILVKGSRGMKLESLMSYL